MSALLERLEPSEVQLASVLGRTSPLVKLAIALLWLLGLAFTTRLWPPVLLTVVALLAGRGLPGSPHQWARSRPFFTELRVSEDSPIAGLSVAAAEKQLGGTIYTHLRNDRHVFGSRRHHTLRPGDILLVEADSKAITEASRLQEVELEVRDRGSAGDAWIEAVVLPQSMIIGSTARTIEAFSTRGIQIVAIATRLQRVEGRLADLPHLDRLVGSRCAYRNRTRFSTGHYPICQQCIGRRRPRTDYRGARQHGGHIA